MKNGMSIEDFMQKFLIISFILASLPCYSACPIEEGATSCSIAEIMEPQPFARTYGSGSSIKEFSDTPEARLKPSQNNLPSKQLRDFGPQTADYSYNTSCQFGICNPSGTPQLFEKRGQ